MEPKFKIGDPVWWVRRSDPWFPTFVASIEYGSWYYEDTGETNDNTYGYRIDPDPGPRAGLPVIEQHLLPRNQDQHKGCEDGFKEELKGLLKQRVSQK